MAKKDQYVTEGATLECTMGNKTCSLKVTNNRIYRINNKKVATEMDFLPGVNLFPPLGTFGVCKLYSSVPPPGNLCTPILAGPWKMPYMTKTIGILKPLLGSSFNVCTRGGGMIKIKKVGQ